MQVKYWGVATPAIPAALTPMVALYNIVGLRIGLPYALIGPTFQSSHGTRIVTLLLLKPRLPCRAIHPRGQSDDIITGSLGLCRINFHLCCIFIISRIMPHALRQSFCYEIFIDAARIACGAEQGLCNGRVSFRPSVCLVNRQQQRGAAGLRLSAGACSRHRSIVCTTAAHTQQQMRVASC